MSDLYVRAVEELKSVFETFDDAEAEKAVAALMAAKRIAFYACGRERLQIMGSACGSITWASTSAWWAT